jgi:hypothetical protein
MSYLACAEEKAISVIDLPDDAKNEIVDKLTKLQNRYIYSDGLLRIHIRIDTSGNVTNAIIIRDELKGEASADEIITSVEKMQFSKLPANKLPILLRYTLSFQNGQMRSNLAGLIIKFSIILFVAVLIPVVILANTKGN